MSTPHYERDGIVVHHAEHTHGEGLGIDLPDSSVDAIVTDPPYELGFMGKGWDASGIAYDVALWADCLRVLKPGGHLLAFGGTRTWHRLVVAVEDAGFEIRDSIAWVYASGFPKSLDVSKAIDKARDDRDDIVKVTTWLKRQAWAAGHNRSTVDTHMGTSDMAGWWLTDLRHRCQCPTWEQWERLRDLIGFDDAMDAEVWRLNGRKGMPGEAWHDREVIGERTTGRGTGRGAIAYISDSENRDVTAPATDHARQWQGWGTALKPAHEPIVVARKPLAGTVAGNVLAHGTGALNIDGCRVEAGQDYRDKCASVVGLASNRNGDAYGEWTGARTDSSSPQGRWPSNLVLTHAPDCGATDATPCVPGCPVADLDAQSGVTTSPPVGSVARTQGGATIGTFAHEGRPPSPNGHGDSGGASRFFPTFRYEPKAPTTERPRHGGIAHPTVKPLDLMRWLVRLVTPPGGVVLEPFAGSGTTCEAAALEGFRCIAVEREPDYLPLIVDRLTKHADPVAHLQHRAVGGHDVDLGLLGLLGEGA
jgi:hypothetical protein